MAIPPVAALEIGTTQTVVCVGECDASRTRMRITGIGSCPSLNVRKGEIQDMERVCTCIEKAVKEAEKTSGVDIWQALLAVSGEHIDVISRTVMLPIEASDHTVTREDVEELLDKVNEMQVEHGRQILHTIPQRFTLDNNNDIVKPEGLVGDMLSMDLLAVHGMKHRIDNAINAARHAKIDVSDVVFAGVGAMLSVLTAEQKRNGVLLIDMGGGTTSYVMFNNNCCTAMGCLAVGGDHVTNDIALAFNIPITKAEQIKKTEGSAVIDMQSSKKRIVLEAEINFDERTISCRALQTVIHARIDELLQIIRDKLLEIDPILHLGSGVVLVGGGAYLHGVVEAAEKVFGVKCSIGTLAQIDGIDGIDQPAALASVAGLLVHGMNSYEEQGVMVSVKQFFKRMIKR